MSLKIYMCFDLQNYIPQVCCRQINRTIIHLFPLFHCFLSSEGHFNITMFIILVSNSYLETLRSVNMVQLAEAHAWHTEGPHSIPGTTWTPGTNPGVF